MAHAGTGDSRAQLALTVATLATAIVLGGGQGTLGDTFVQLLAVGLLALLAWRSGDGHAPAWPRWIWIPLVALVAIPALQFLPLPGALWHAPAARAELAAQLDAADVARPGLWSLHPLATLRSLLWLLPGIALYLSMLSLPRAQQATVWRWLLALVLAGGVLGLAQLAQGLDSPLRFYANTNRTSAVGFFANRNHLASLLALSLPLAVAWFGSPAPGNAGDAGLARLRLVAGGGVCVFLLLALAMTLSRAGILLGMLALALVLPLLWTLRRQRRGIGRVATALLLASAVLVVQFALLAILQRFGQDPLGDDRVAIAANTLEAANAHAPLGSGLGTFRQAYAPFDVLHARADAEAIVNHAHNDVTELWLELGWLLPPAALLFVGFVLFVAVRAVRRAATPAARLVAAALCIALAVPLLHSLVDYPLRTSAHLAVAGMLLGMIARLALAPARTATRVAGDDADRAGPSPATAGIGYTGT